MRRADRLFQIVQLIRGRRLSTAAFLARRLEVSERTIYRDIADLQRQGVPIDGEAGVGYRLGAGFQLPPLMFTPDEAQALVAAARWAQTWLDPALATHAQDALGKILSVLPSATRASAESTSLYAPLMAVDAGTLERLQVLREATEKRYRLQVHYRDAQDAISQRVVQPLGCFYWGKVWTLAAWCEGREDFRSFRVDRIIEVSTLREHFAVEPGKTLADFVRSVSACQH